MSHSTRVKPQPTAEDLRDMMECVETMESELDTLQARVRHFDLLSTPQIGALGLMTLNQEIDKARSAIEWLGIIIGDAEDDLNGLTSEDAPIMPPPAPPPEGNAP